MAAAGVFILALLRPNMSELASAPVVESTSDGVSPPSTVIASTSMWPSAAMAVSKKARRSF